ncbi:MAG: ATP-binding protein [Pseudomonadota bacterium]
MRRPRLTLAAWLLATLVGTLAAFEVATVLLDRYQRVTLEGATAFAHSPIDVTERAMLLRRFPPEERPTIARSLSNPSSQFFVRPVAGFHPEDVRDPEVERQARDFLRALGYPVAEIRAGRRRFEELLSTPGKVPSSPEEARRMPDMPWFLRSTRRPRPAFRLNPGMIHPWISGDWADVDPSGRIERTSEPETGPPRSDPDVRPLPLPPAALRSEVAEVYTFAVRMVGDEEWTTLYRLYRVRPWNLEFVKLGLSLVAAFLVGAVAVLVGRAAIAPLRDLARGAERLSRGERAPDVVLRGARDVQEIVAAFNAMNARVSQATDYQIALLRSIGHDLKGPLAAARRLVVDVGPNETRRQIEARLENVQSIVEAIMSFSRATMRDGPLERTDLSELVHAIVDEQVDQGAEATADTPGRLLVECRVNATQRALRNLVENAVKYGGGARVRLVVEGAEAVIRIDDDGPGLPQATLADAFEPFVRLSGDMPGTGLGLAIARTIAVDQGGSVTIANRHGGGLRAELRLLMPSLDGWAS